MEIWRSEENLCDVEEDSIRRTVFNFPFPRDMPRPCARTVAALACVLAAIFVRPPTRRADTDGAYAIATPASVARTRHCVRQWGSFVSGMGRAGRVNAAKKLRQDGYFLNEATCVCRDQNSFATEAAPLGNGLHCNANANEQNRCEICRVRLSRPNNNLVRVEALMHQRRDDRDALLLRQKPVPMGVETSMT